MTKTLEAHGKKLTFDEDGYMKDIDLWDVRIAEELARLDNIKELSAEHWKLITAIRFHYEKFKESPV